MAFFSGIVDALKGIDTETLLKGIVGIGLLAAIMAALSAVAALVPGAMLGVLGMGAVIAELALVLAAVGALAQIPGLNWLINEGGNLLQGIGTAIGKFVGGIVGGFMSGVSSQFPQIGSDLSGFMANVQPFLDGAASIDPATYLMYRKWIKPCINFQQLKRKVSRYDKYDEKRVYQKLVSLYTAKGGKSHGVKLQVRREHSPANCT